MLFPLALFYIRHVVCYQRILTEVADSWFLLKNGRFVFYSQNLFRANAIP